VSVCAVSFVQSTVLDATCCHCVSLQVVTVVTVKMVVFRDVTPCSLVDGPAASSMRTATVKGRPDDGCSRVF
jgi:hypothetical protein